MGSFFVVKSKKGGNGLNSIFKYKENNDEVIITGLQEGVSDTSIVIPETIDGMPVTAIADEAFKESSITDIKIGENIRKIGKQAFYMCNKLSSVTWNCKCNAIPAYGFYECPNLKQFDFSDIEKVGKYAFYKSGLQEVCLPENIEVVSEWAFYGCEKLSSVIWNCKCDVISACCFAECSNLTNFDFSNIKKIGRYAFWESGLQEICLPKSIEILEEGTFSGCSELQSVTWNCTCDVIPANCFFECSNLTHFDFSVITKIEKYSFSRSGLQEVSFPENIKIIEEGAFRECSGLRSVTWNCTCDVIPANCFSECSNLTNFDFSNIKKIGRYAFWESGLQEICLPKSIEILEEGTFSGCSELQSVTWNCTCDVIPNFCFAACSNLTNFDFSSIEKIGKYAFEESGLQEVFLPEKIKIIEEGAFRECSGLRSVTWDCTCDVIPALCFAVCSNLTQFALSGIKKVGTSAFEKSGLTSVTLSKGTEVCKKCFAHCKSLAKVEWLSARNIKGDIFMGCEDIKEICISDKVKNIEARAFVSSPDAEITFI